MVDIGEIKENLLFRGIKVANIAIIGNIYLVLCIFASLIIDKSFQKMSKEYTQKSTGILFGEIILQTSVIMIVTYFIRIGVKMIPNPFDGIRGFKADRLKELGGPLVAGFAMFVLQTHYMEKIKYLINDRLAKLVMKIPNPLKSKEDIDMDNSIPVSISSEPNISISANIPLNNAVPDIINKTAANLAGNITKQPATINIPSDSASAAIAAIKNKLAV